MKRTHRHSYIQTTSGTFSFGAFVFLLLFSIQLNSQAAVGNYFAVQYLKVQPQMENEFIELETQVWKKIHEQRMKEDILDGWYLYRVLAPSGTTTEYNYILMYEYDSAEKIAGHFDGYGVNYSALLDKDEIVLALRTPEIRDMVYEEVWRTVDQTMTPNSQTLFKYTIFNSMKMKPGIDEGEYQRMEQEYWKPMHEERIRRNMMYGWGMYTMIIPGGTERNYHWATVDYYHNFIDYLRETQPIMNQIHGKEKADMYLEETISKRDLLKGEIRELVDYMTSPEN